MDDDLFIPYMVMRGTIGMLIPNGTGNLAYYNPDPAGYRDLPPEFAGVMTGGDFLVDGYEDEDPIVDDDGNVFLRE